ncbi:hypothetical protein OG874_25505 [Nocardia sp. NBC_00565]|uniref:hypothetical protein n=1 Tax=Nocardia sp. NBC_00565 TaxID=2975993 RepID=UPI002E8229D5|nr:hypothetical protein [Nocardia sp. NBC_00565]WUC00254.1 hypothetical protein OG874_25505 [Nocardia sp. NBC_00565]
MPGDGYDNDRKPFDNNERGRIFENGSDRFFRDRENGYVHHSRIYEHGKDRIQFDKVKEDRGQTYSIEDKSGRIGGEKDVKQLEVVRALIEKGEVHHHLLRSVDGETISKPAKELIDGLVRDYPDNFTHQIISREDAREIWSRGLEREPAPQLELPGVGEQARQQKERQREARQLEKERQERTRVPEKEQRARDKELARSVDSRELNAKREQLRVDVAEQARKMAEARQKGQAVELEKIRESHTRLTKDLADIREIERAKAREMIRGAGLGREPAQEMERHLEQNREEQRKDVTRELGEIGSTIAREDDRRHERETVEKQREQVREVRERAVREGVPREVMQVLEVGRLQPGEQPRVREEHREHDDHRAREAARERERVAERERERARGREQY